MNPMLDEDGYYFDYEKYPDIIKDDRFVNKMEVTNKFSVIYYSGYTYNKNHLDDEYM